MKRTLLALAALLPAFAWAHIGPDAGAHHGSAFLQGFVHPFSGLDHMAAMLAVGAWSVLSFRQSSRAMWAVPGAFALLLLVGGIAAFGGVGLPGVEPMIAASLVVLGLLVASRAQLPVGVGAALVGGFALFHGLAHGAELAAATALGGMVLGTLLLHVAGMALGRFVLDRQVWLPRLAGLGVALFGAGLLAF